MGENFGYRDPDFVNYISKQRVYNREAAKLLLIPYSSLTDDQKKKVKTRFIIKQDAKCAICGQPEKELRKKLVLDHNHTTDKVRGLLCNRCNSMLGGIEDKDFLKKAINYLEISS